MAIGIGVVQFTGATAITIGAPTGGTAITIAHSTGAIATTIGTGDPLGATVAGGEVAFQFDVAKSSLDKGQNLS
jgi:hypothetical protein